ncbi:MAG: serine/threonine-protein phosphatase [Deltaproteobacteria bacterium]|nr:serine/threonine-protein phosphatase [Deltaproteobacteria bacterium]
MKASLCCSMNIGPRPNQQDAIYAAGRVFQAENIVMRDVFSGPLLVLGVCDGLGGHAAGETASRFVCEKLEGVFAADGLDQPGIGNAFGAVQADMASGQVDPDSGTTMCALACDGSRVVVVNAGDSRAYRFGPDGLVRLSHDHSFVQRLVDDKLITDSEAFAHPFRNLVDFGLGPTFADRWDINQPIYFYEEKAEPGAVYMLCSDGVSDMLPDRRLFEELSDDPLKNAEKLFNLLKALGMKDNASMILARIESVP